MYGLLHHFAGTTCRLDQNHSIHAKFIVRNKSIQHNLFIFILVVSVKVSFFLKTSFIQSELIYIHS